MLKVLLFLFTYFYAISEILGQIRENSLQGLAFGEFCAVLKCVGDENYQNCAEALFYPGEKWGEMAERALVSNSY